MTIYKESVQMLFTKTATCAEHGTFGNIHWSDAAPYRRFAEFKDGGTGVGSLMLLNIWGQAHASQ